MLDSPLLKTQNSQFFHKNVLREATTLIISSPYIISTLGRLYNNSLSFHFLFLNSLVHQSYLVPMFVLAVDTAEPWGAVGCGEGGAPYVVGGGNF